MHRRNSESAYDHPRDVPGSLTGSEKQDDFYELVMQQNLILSVLNVSNIPFSVIYQ